MRVKLTYIVVENSGLMGEFDAARFDNFYSARRWMERSYTEAQRDKLSPHYLAPAICVEEPNGTRSYEI